MQGSSWGKNGEPASWRAGRAGVLQVGRGWHRSWLGSTRGLDLGTRLGRCGFRIMEAMPSSDSIHRVRDRV